MDLSAYRRAASLVVRYPTVLAGPLVAGVLADLELVFAPNLYAGALGDTIASIVYRYVSLLIVSFGLAFALIGADAAWRGNERSLSDCARMFGKHVLTIFFTALGANFMIFVASQVGALLGPIAGFASAALSFGALFFLAYAYPGAAIDGIPAATAIEMSIERAWDNRSQTVALALTSLVVLQFVPTLVEMVLEPLMLASGLFDNAVIPSLAIVVVASIVNTYLAFVIAKIYADLPKPQRPAPR